MNDSTREYYAHDMVKSGRRFLVSKMCASQFKNDTDLYNKVTDTEIDFQICLSRFTSNLTRSQQQEFGQVMNYVNKIYVQQEIKPLCIVPANYSDIRRMYVDGDMSIAKHIPVPEVTWIVDHSFVSILDCICDFLLRQDNIICNINNWDTIISNYIPNNDMHLFRCKRVNDIIAIGKNRLYKSSEDDPIMVPILITLWSDDFDPNKSIKCNRQSCWVKTVTIFTMDNHGNKVKGTYPLSLSLKGARHEVVEFQYLLQLSNLSSGEMMTAYSRSHKSIVYIHADLFCVLNDQPERRSNLGLHNGNSLLHGRFGIILDARQVQASIRSCKKCSASIIEESLNTSDNTNMRYEWRENNCNICSSWLYHLNHKLLHYTPEKNYPIEVFSDDLVDGKLKPKIISKELIERGVRIVLHHLRSNEITSTQAKIYLKNIGMNSEAYNKIIDNEHNHKKYELPSAWYDFDSIKLYVDAPMHLLMLGITKTVVLKIMKWLRHLNQTPNFLTIAKGVLLNVKAMNIEWCKILEYPTTDKCGGWVSENFVAMARLGNWFYSLLRFLPFAKKYIDPKTHHSTWNKQESEKWLQVRGIRIKGSSAELKKLISDYHSSNNIPEITKKHSIDIEDVTNLINSTCLMISKLMTINTKKEDIIRVEAIIRMFLIHFDKLDYSISGDNAVPSWIKSYNLLCLLNVPELMRNYGNIRNLWEGGNDGESYVKIVKSHMKGGLVNGWQQWVVSNMLKEEIYNKWKSTPNKGPTVREEVRVYSNHIQAKCVIASGKPVSCLTYNKSIFICYRCKGIIRAQRIILYNKVELEYGKTYYSVKLANSSIVVSLNDVRYVGIILLPLLTYRGYPNEEDNDKKYCYIQSDWLDFQT